ncbi:MAG: 23S rRNA (adenine(2503)-C(2))-methyltransferase RlmN [Lachnospiraceae bacterium]|nr:23S rRNA (adenine(2503)-C(2))-methyltransferase RlmN [Lachnospiraceae bacterium]MBR0402041.1 23S rRNA (adenine(2503)-C(2))-methyltransferase RlmN [Lachnospiraceae bacterium]
MEKKDMKSMYLSELQQEFAALGQPKFRAGQVFDWIHAKQVTEFTMMTNLPKALREELAASYAIPSVTVEDRLISQIDGTEKYLLALPDGNAVEAVLMTYDYGKSLCVSSQVGCRMGCAFCASTLHGLVRNLSAAEMLDEVYRVQSLTDGRIDHVVIMGCGEPLDNYDNVVRFIRLLSDPHGHNMSVRHITVSTCGLAPRILDLAGEDLPVTLALSLHAPNDEIRRTLMPVAKRYALPEVLSACDAYFAATGRRVSYEYCLIDGVNDTDGHAEELARLLAGKNCHVNLIPMNPVEERAHLRETRGREQAFKNKLEKLGINATIRKKMGRDIAGACGQLRNSRLEREG